MSENMDNLHAALLLYQHNEWRRGNDNYDMANPKELGIAIDLAVAALRTPDTTAPEEWGEDHDRWQKALNGDAPLCRPVVDWWWLEHKLALRRSVIRQLERQKQSANTLLKQALGLMMDIHPMIEAATWRAEVGEQITALRKHLEGK